MNINSLTSLNNKVWMTEDRINELEDIAVEFTQSEQQRANRLEVKNKQPQTFETIIRNPIYFLIRVPEGERRVWMKEY